MIIDLLFNIFKRSRFLIIFVLAAAVIAADCSCDHSTSGNTIDNSPDGGSEKTQNVVLFMEVNEDYSCPFLYTWNGCEYVIENDIYSVARTQMREYIDYLYIQNNIIDKNGEYVFRVRERDNEESWTDTLSLAVIDHDFGVEVGTDSTGNFHSFSNLFAPDSAYNEKGDDLLPVLLDDDDLSWEARHNETLLMDFSSVDISNGAKLVVRIDGFEGDLIGKKTGQIPSLLIQTLENDEWITRHKFFPKEFWAIGIFDLQPYFTESKQVRFVSVSCHDGKYHCVDSVALDNTLDNLDVVILSPSAARLNEQEDVLKALLDSDDDYAFTEKGEYIDIAFPCPPRAQEGRHFVFISEGYYRAAGNTFYIYTLEAEGWALRYDFEPLNYQMDTLTNVDLSQYLPDIENEFKIKIEHRVQPGVEQFAEGNLDYIFLLVEGEKYIPFSGFNTEGLNILDQITLDDDVYWLATDQAAIIYFKPD